MLASPSSNAPGVGGACPSKKTVDEPAWGRLTSMLTLSLQWPRVAAPSLYQGSGLAGLPALEDLDLEIAPKTDSAAPATDKLLGTPFASSHLKTLRFNDDPFEGGLDLCKLPALLNIFTHVGRVLCRSGWRDNHLIV